MDFLRTFREAFPGQSAVVFVGGMALIGALLFGVVAYVVDRALVNSQTKPPSDTRKEVQAAGPIALATTALFVKAELDSLPISIPAHSEIYIVPINKRRMTSPHSPGGFFRAGNGANAAVQWPDAKVWQEADTAANPATFVWRAELTNHGPTALLDISILLQFHFGNDKSAVTHRVIVSPLTPGRTFTFYLINDCPQMAVAIWPSNATAKVLGEDAAREVPLHVANTGLVDQSMTFFWSSTRLIGGEPCEESVPTPSAK
jgi:hypothetical protein